MTYSVSETDGASRRPLQALAGRVDRSWWRWLPVPLAALYLILLLAQFGTIIGSTYLDADTASGPVIAELFGSAGPHATTVLGTFGWYSTLLFDLATKWLPLHRQIWEGAPYAMALGAAALTAWSVWQLTGRWAAAISAALMICAAPHTLHLLLSTTEHGPDWFCLALLGAFLVLIEHPGISLRPLALGLLVLAVGVVIGVNAASDSLVSVAGLVPFALAVGVCYVRRRDPTTTRGLLAAIAVLVVVGVSWEITRAAMSAAHVVPQPGVDNTLLAAGDQVSNNVKLWWQSIAVLGNGDFFGRRLSVTAGLAVLCALLSVGSVVLLPRFAWRGLRISREAPPETPSHRFAFIGFWGVSAILLSVAFWASATPVDINADRYLVGLVYAVAAVIPVVAAGRLMAERVVVAGTAVFALTAVFWMANGTTTSNSGVALTDGQVNQVIRIAERHGLSLGYAGYWDAAPITWASGTQVRVYPVSTCGSHLCPFYLHYISSWYTPHPGVGRSFLLTDTAPPLVPAPPGGLGQPSAVYHAGTITMYVYPYDLASRLA